jgi:hypothetical protein
VAEPREFAREACEPLSERDTQNIMYDNGRRFMPVQV